MAYALAAGLGLVVLGAEGRARSGRAAGSSIPAEILVGAAALIIISSFENVTQTLLFGLGRAGSVAAVFSCAAS